jgi:hypothetical protein
MKKAKSTNYRLIAEKHLQPKDWIKFIDKVLHGSLITKATQLNNVLSELFTERQKYIIYRRMYGLSLSKTEREYYYRVVKKRLKAIANPHIHTIALEALAL